MISLSEEKIQKKKTEQKNPQFSFVPKQCIALCKRTFWIVIDYEMRKKQNIISTEMLLY